MLSMSKSLVVLTILFISTPALAAVGIFPCEAKCSVGNQKAVCDISAAGKLIYADCDTTVTDKEVTCNQIVITENAHGQRFEYKVGPKVQKCLKIYDENFRFYQEEIYNPDGSIKIRD